MYKDEGRAGDSKEYGVWRKERGTTNYRPQIKDRVEVGNRKSEFGNQKSVSSSETLRRG